MRASAMALGVALACAPLVSAPLAAEDLVVIVHPDRAHERLDADDVAQIYLKQRLRWRDGKTIVPVNREPESDTRAAFARAVLELSPQQLSVHWNRQYFLGVRPPATLASDEAVKRFVAREKRAIGYVRASAIDASVRVALRLPERPSRSPRE